MQHGRYPKEVVLKDGTEVTFRPMDEGDVEALKQFYRTLSPSFLWYMKEDPNLEEILPKWLDKQSQGKAFSIVADAGGTIAGHATMLLRPHGGRRHVGRVRAYVADDHQKKQLGTWMMFDLIRHAMDLDLEMLRTDFVVGMDDLAIDAAKKLDFVTEGLLKDYVKDEKGNYHDYQIMIKHIHKEWSDF